VAGSKLRSVLAARSMVAPSTFFRKGGYGTWQSFAPPFRWHQIDHFFCAAQDLRRVTNCRRWGQSLVDSDHRAVILTLRVRKRLKKRVVSERSKLAARDGSQIVGQDE